MTPPDTVLPVPDKYVAVTTGNPIPHPVVGAAEEKWPEEEIFVTVIACEYAPEIATVNTTNEKSTFLNIVLIFVFFN